MVFLQIKNKTIGRFFHVSKVHNANNLFFTKAKRELHKLYPGPFHTKTFTDYPLLASEICFYCCESRSEMIFRKNWQ